MPNNREPQPLQDLLIDFLIRFGEPPDLVRVDSASAPLLPASLKETKVLVAPGHPVPSEDQ